MPYTPAETGLEARHRSRVIYAFWAVILFLGLPIWLVTTSIYRADLPVKLMRGESTSSDTGTSSADLWYSIPICLHVDQLSPSTRSQFAEELQEQALLSDEHGLARFQIVTGKDCTLDHTSLLLQEARDGAPFSYEYSTKGIIADVNSNLLPESISRLVNLLKSTFQEEHASMAYTLLSEGKANAHIQSFANNLPGELRDRVQKSSKRAIRPDTEYHFTFSLLTAGSVPNKWAAKPLIDAKISPILHALELSRGGLHKFTVSSQIQLFSESATLPHPISSSSENDTDTEAGWQFSQQDLKSFTNTAEWPLSPGIGVGPTLNFIAYVPRVQHIPVSIQGGPNSWLVPQWGGITLLNPRVLDVEESELGRKTLVDTLHQSDLEAAFDVFQTQLLQLLGVPSGVTDNGNGPSRLPLSIRLKSWQRLSSLNLYLRTTSTLDALATLSENLKQIPIPRHVLDYVLSALSGLQSWRSNTQSTHTADSQTTSDPEEPTSWGHALRAVGKAYRAGETAFFDRSMVGQVYFPDEHKVAVYLPLLGPVGVPLLMGLVREVRKIKFGRG